MLPCADGLAPAPWVVVLLLEVLTCTLDTLLPMCLGLGTYMNELIKNLYNSLQLMRKDHPNIHVRNHCEKKKPQKTVQSTTYEKHA